MTAANTTELMQNCIGKKIIGVVAGVFPLGRADLNCGTRTFIFDDGTAFTFSSNGSFWTESNSDLRLYVGELRERLKRENKNVYSILQMAGQLGM